MATINNETASLLQPAGPDIVVWEQKYVTGIKLIDEQHKTLVSLTNELYNACLSGDAAAGTVFKESMSRMVDYVRVHFTTEQILLQKIGYPHYPDHKKKHDHLIKTILEAAKEYKEGKKFVPNNFVRALKDWIFGHIAIEDMAYAAFAANQKKKGLLTNVQLES